MRQRLASEAGMTLVEVLVALVILTTAVVGLTSGLGTLAVGSDRHRNSATADTVVRQRAEEIKLQVRNAPANAWCVTSSSSVISGYTVQVTPLTTPSACNNTTSSMQQIRLTASSTATHAGQAQVVLTVRKP
ncbi:MAG TPA: prepilin-type N-terminal cleavage/methylation domain-containing protein [Acidimicrobiia bacterium]|nr:prepilin-type N-terminal cleavage/methylation domain-containing protein [Acidimicrobiia bacterium]